MIDSFWLTQPLHVSKAFHHIQISDSCMFFFPGLLCMSRYNHVLCIQPGLMFPPVQVVILVTFLNVCKKNLSMFIGIQTGLILDM